MGNMGNAPLRGYFVTPRPKCPQVYTLEALR